VAKPVVVAPAAQTERSKSNRVNLKINLELNKIKVVIVEIKRKASLATTGSLAREDSTIPANLNHHQQQQQQHGAGRGSLKTSASFDTVTNNLNSVAALIMSSASKFTPFGLLEIQDTLFDFASNENSTWLANLKFRALNVNDLRPDSNLAVKEYVLINI
jgi:hypothetical protein